MRVRTLLVVPAVTALLCTFATGVAHASGTSYSWVGSTGGGDGHSWSDASNWNPQGIPGQEAGDSASIAPPDPAHCTANVDNVPLVTLVSLSIAVSPSSCGASLKGGPITVTGAFSWNGGTLNAPTTIAPGATGSISGSNSHLNDLAQTLTVGGTLTLSDIADSGASNQGGLRINNHNDATIPQVNLLHVLPGGTLNSDGPNTITFLSCCVSPARVVNDGTLSVSSGDLEVDGVAIDQNGTLATGTDDPGRLVADGDPVTAASGASYTGNGSWLIRNGSIARLIGTQNLGAGFHLELGGIDVAAGARLGGTATLGGTGTLDWTGGTIEGNLTIGHGVTMEVSGAHTGNGHRTLYGSDGTGAGNPVASTLTNHGTIKVENGAAITTGGPAHLDNAVDGTVSFAPGTGTSSLSCCVNPDRLTNSGTLVVPTGSSADPVVLTNLAYQVSGGSTSIAAGRQLHLDGGAPNKLTDTTVTGGGTLALTEPTAVSGTVTIGPSTDLALEPHGTLDGTATISGAGALSWTGGSMSGNVTVAPTGGISVTGLDQKYVSNVNGGATRSNVTLKSPTTIGAGTSPTHNLINVGQSTLTLASSTTMANYTEIYAGTLVNTGSLTLNPGSAGQVTRSGSGPTTNRGTVTLQSGTFALGDSYTQAAGSTKIAAGTHFNLVFVTRTVAVTGGILQGAGSIGAGVSNSGGTVSPSGTGIATLHIAGSYTQGTKGHLALDLSAKAHDLLAVAGSASLQGSLGAHNVTGYKPKAGAKFTLVTAQALTTGMSCVTTSGTASSGTGAGHWATGHTATSLTLTWKSGAHTHC